MMHGQKNIKLCNAEQAKRVYQYKNIKIKLHKNNAAIWYNKISSPLSTRILYVCLQRVTIPEAVDTIGPPDDEQRAARNMLRSVL